jgi:hypothetical protein
VLSSKSMAVNPYTIIAMKVFSASSWVSISSNSKSETTRSGEHLKEPGIDCLRSGTPFKYEAWVSSVSCLLKGPIVANGTHPCQYCAWLLTAVVIETAEPEIVKTILATKFDDFALSDRRIDAMVPSLGHGIFASNGAAWERSRALIRPNFTRSQVADLDTFETHIQHFISAIPRDGSTVDLQPLFFSLTMDSATEFLFGRSTDCLAPGLETHSASEFVKAFVSTYPTCR